VAEDGRLVIVDLSRGGRGHHGTAVSHEYGGCMWASSWAGTVRRRARCACLAGEWAEMAVFWLAPLPSPPDRGSFSLQATAAFPPTRMLSLRPYMALISPPSPPLSFRVTGNGSGPAINGIACRDESTFISVNECSQVQVCCTAAGCLRTWMYVWELLPSGRCWLVSPLSGWQANAPPNTPHTADHACAALGHPKSQQGCLCDNTSRCNCRRWTAKPGVSGSAPDAAGYLHYRRQRWCLVRVEAWPARVPIVGHAGAHRSQYVQTLLVDGMWICQHTCARSMLPPATSNSTPSQPLLPHAALLCAHTALRSRPSYGAWFEYPPS